MGCLHSVYVCMHCLRLWHGRFFRRAPLHRIPRPLTTLMIPSELPRLSCFRARASRPGCYWNMRVGDAPPTPHHRHHLLTSFLVVSRAGFVHATPVRGLVASTGFCCGQRPCQLRVDGWKGPPLRLHSRRGPCKIGFGSLLDSRGAWTQYMGA